MEDRALMFALGDAVATVDKMRGAATRFVFRSGLKSSFTLCTLAGSYSWVKCEPSALHFCTTSL